MESFARRAVIGLIESGICGLLVVGEAQKLEFGIPSSGRSNPIN